MEKFKCWLAGVLCNTFGCCSIWSSWFEWPHSVVCSSRLMHWLDGCGDDEEELNEEDEAAEAEDDWWDKRL